MQRSKINAVIAVLMFIVFIFCFYSGFVLQFILQRRVFGFHGGIGNLYEFPIAHLGLSRGDWLNLHTWSGWIFFGLIIIHLILHLNWIRRVPGFSSK